MRAKHESPENRQSTGKKEDKTIVRAGHRKLGDVAVVDRILRGFIEAGRQRSDGEMHAAGWATPFVRDG